MGISTKEISEVIKERLKDFDASLVSTDVGRIVATKLQQLRRRLTAS